MTVDVKNIKYSSCRNKCDERKSHWHFKSISVSFAGFYLFFIHTAHLVWSFPSSYSWINCAGNTWCSSTWYCMLSHVVWLHLVVLIFAGKPPKSVDENLGHIMCFFFIRGGNKEEDFLLQNIPHFSTFSTPSIIFMCPLGFLFYIFFNLDLLTNMLISCLWIQDWAR